MDTTNTTGTLNIVGERGSYPRVELEEPGSSGYLLIAAEVDARPPFLPNSRRKRKLIERLKRWCAQLQADDEVVEAIVFDALLIPPGRGEFLKERPASARIARYDLAVLIETTTPSAARKINASPICQSIVAAVSENAHDRLIVAASNVKRIGPVDHRRDGAFLFNFFFADDVQQNLAIWEYTAGWFQQETGLDNSTVLLPLDGERSPYAIVNHCRWNGLRDFLPALLLKESFRSYVLANFRANRVAAQPIIYRLA